MAGSAGFGSKFYRMSGTSSTAVAGVTSIGGPGIEGDAIDISDMDSADGFREFAPGLVDAGDVELGLNYTKAEVAALHALWRATGTYKVVFPDSASWSFSGFLNGIENEAPHDDKITSDATFKISGKPTFATSG
jgi:hypothetical protein